MNYDNNQLENMLMELKIEQIEKIRDEYQEKHLQGRSFSVLCQCVIGRKRDLQNRKDFAELIEKVKNESAPSGATNTEQGKQPVNTSKDRSTAL